MGYSVGDRVEVKPKGKTRVVVNGVLVERTWKLWLLEIIPMEPGAIDQLWRAKFTRVSHSTLISERWIVRKISSNFEGFQPNQPLDLAAEEHGRAA